MGRVAGFALALGDLPGVFGVPGGLRTDSAPGGQVAGGEMVTARRRSKANTRKVTSTRLRARVKTPKTNGFVERLNGTVLDEFFRVKMRETFYETVEALQADLDAWLVHHNAERPHLGYRNQGRRPIETINQFVSQEA